MNRSPIRARWTFATTGTLLIAIATTVPAQAHHMMGGAMPATFGQGLLSGLGHPIIGIDHLAFLVAMGVAVGAAGLHLGVPFAFVAASAVGVALHVTGVTVPVSEVIVALTVLLAGGLVASGRNLGPWAWAALFAAAGLFHGYAFGESIFGAERTPLMAYLIGLVAIQTVLATAVALLTRRFGTSLLAPRMAGAVVAGIGIAVLAAQVLPH
jgi:urease accessory protein